MVWALCPRHARGAGGNKAEQALQRSGAFWGPTSVCEHILPVPCCVPSWEVRTDVGKKLAES